MKYIIIILLISSCNSYRETATPISVSDSISNETYGLRDSLSASIDSLDSLRPVIQKTVAQLKYYEQLKDNYEKKEIDIRYRPIVDSSEIAVLRNKLNSANNEIFRLNGELASIERKRNISPVKDVYSMMIAEVETPDENSVIITLDGSSKRGEIFIPNDLTIYLIPYNKKLKKILSYEPSCNVVGISAKYYKGLYYFNDVVPGKYIIKICTYFGNYRVINKEYGKYNVTMQIAPPIQ